MEGDCFGIHRIGLIAAVCNFARMDYGVSLELGLAALKRMVAELKQTGQIDEKTIDQAERHAARAFDQAITAFVIHPCMVDWDPDYVDELRRNENVDLIITDTINA